MTMNVDGKWLQEALNTLGIIGFVPSEGTTRLAYHPAYDKGRDYVKGLMEDAGLQTAIDRVGNLTGKLPGQERHILAVGSHLDTVPGGGMFDGALGVLAGIACLRALQQQHYFPRHTLEVIGFTEEEGNVVGGTFGSKCFAGGVQEETALERMHSHGLTPFDIAASRRCAADYKCYLEYHIEQGGILESTGTHLGIVQGIVAIARFEITVNGVANHAGSTPMRLRDDALVKASRMIVAAEELSLEIDPEMTCTTGTLQVLPGAVNVIAGRVTFPIELRCIRPQSIRAFESRFGKRFAGQMEMRAFLWQDETQMDAQLQAVFRMCAEARGVPVQELPSGAGHDAINMAQFTKTAMLFIPSRGGISHSPLEYSDPADVQIGANVLLDTWITLDQTL